MRESAEDRPGATPARAAAVPRALLAGAAALVSLYFAWIFLVYVPGVEATAVAHWSGRLRAMAEDRAAAVDGWLAERRADAETYTHFPSPQALLGLRPPSDVTGSDVEAHVREILAAMVRTHDNIGAFVQDAAGRPRAYAGEAMLDPAHPAVRAVAADAVAAGNPRVDLVLAGERAVVVVAAPVALRSGAAAGAVVVLADPAASLFPLLAAEPVPSRTVETLLVRRDGAEAVFLSPLRHRPGPPLSQRVSLESPGIPAREALEGRSGERASTDYRGAPIVAATRRLREAPWGLIVKIDREEALEQAGQEVTSFLLAALASLFGFLGVGFGIVRSMRARHGAAHAALRESEARFAALREHAVDAIFFCGAHDLRIRDANAAAEKMYGRARAELVGASIELLRPEADRAEAREVAAEVVRRGAATVEVNHIRRDGTVFPVEITARAFELGGEPLILAAVRDITERRASVARIERLNRVLRTLSEVNQLLIHSPDEETLLSEICRIAVEEAGFLLAWVGLREGADARVRVAAKAGAALAYLDGADIRCDDSPRGRGPTGVAIREGRAVTVDDFEVDPGAAPWREAARRSGIRSSAAAPVRRGGEVVGALSLYSKERAAFDAEVLALLEEMASDIGYALGAIAERRRREAAEADLRANEARLRTSVEELRRAQEQARRVLLAIEQAEESVVITDREGTIVYANPAVARRTGYALEEMLGRTPRMWKSDRHGPELYEDMWRTIAGGDPWHGTLTNRSKDGKLFQEDVAIHPVRAEDGTVEGFVAVKRDVTRERDLEQQLLQAQKLEAVGQLAGGVAHDFNNALGGVIGYADLALMEVDERDPVRPHLLEIRKAGERAAAIARQLLIFSRRQVVDLRVVAVDQVVEGLLKMLRRLLGEEVTLDTHIQGGMPTVRADVGQLEQVIINLCLNARDAMPTGGRITIAAAVADPAEVPESASAGAASDSGEREGAGAAAGPAPAEAGTAPAEAGTGTGTGTSGRIPKRPVAWIRLSIEDTGSGIPPEVKAHLFEPFFTTKPRGKGTGLGLAVVHGIIAKHGGAIAVDSEVGAGTTFRIYLPATGEPTSDRAPAPTEPAVGGTETVLVVDDDPGVREVAQRALVRLGYRALVASSAYEALGLADRTPGEIHVLLTDVVMPGPSGVDLSAEIRKTRPGIRVLFMSGHLPDKVEARGVKGSETEFIGKPFEVGNLARKLRRLLDRPRTEEGKRLA